ncbi:cold shock domain-containing protein [Streptomyces kasugaensis]|uniref:Cold shock domain-containing protein n=1 Tax=Streptomyces kasugaensis TaxID=1946 RepID=A0A4Q9HST4_STRKA|nr:cold shock domain-containing protein [Streptomyces kasugaensis]
MLTGNVKWFNCKKGFGFIVADDGCEIFVHQSNVSMLGFRTLRAGARVEFLITRDERGLQAINVHPLADGSSGSGATRRRTRNGKPVAKGPTQDSPSPAAPPRLGTEPRSPTGTETSDRLSLPANTDWPPATPP